MLGSNSSNTSYSNKVQPLFNKTAFLAIFNLAKRGPKAVSGRTLSSFNQPPYREYLRPTAYVKPRLGPRDGVNNWPHKSSPRKGVQGFDVNFGLFLTCASSVMKMPTFSESEIKHFDKIGLAPLPCT